MFADNIGRVGTVLLICTYVLITLHLLVLLSVSESTAWSTKFHV